VEHVRLTVDTARVERWKAAAEAEKLDLTDRIVAAADNAARHVVVPGTSLVSARRFAITRDLPRHG
jgi:hypothetical protein